MTLRFGILGFPVSHSRSPDFFRAKFLANGIDAEYSFFEVKPEDLAGFIKKVRDENIQGLSVTLPYKEKILEFLDEVEEDARFIGAVNTVVHRDGKLYGFNTDFKGIHKILQDVCRHHGFSTLKGKEIVLLGAGGTAAAAAYACSLMNAKVTILNRTLEKAEHLAQKFGFRAGKLEHILNSPADIVIQTTSVGMAPHSDHTPIPSTYFQAGKTSKDRGEAVLFQPIAIDVIYTPRETQFLKDAKAADWQTISGEQMFLNQAEVQFEIWFHRFKKFSPSISG